MKILAFLQNPWFKPGTSERHIKMYAENDSFHRKVLAGSATGRALRKAFGDELYEKIIWDNASPQHGDTPDSKFPPDTRYMVYKYTQAQPDVVLLFGRQAQDGWDRLVNIYGSLTRSIVFRAPHPMAMGSAKAHLADIVARVKSL